MDSNKFEVEPTQVDIRSSLDHIKKVLTCSYYFSILFSIYFPLKMVNITMKNAKRKEVVWEVDANVPEFVCTDEARVCSTTSSFPSFLLILVFLVDSGIGKSHIQFHEIYQT